MKQNLDEQYDLGRQMGLHTGYGNGYAAGHKDGLKAGLERAFAARPEGVPGGWLARMIRRVEVHGTLEGGHHD